MLFTEKECLLILDSIKNSIGTSDLDIEDRKYKEWLIVDKNVLDFILDNFCSYTLNS